MYFNREGIIIGVIIGSLIIFLVCRELICWYYKINRIVGLMEEQNVLLKQQISLFCKKGKIIIKRIISDKDSDKPIDISIDDKQNISLSNGEEKTIDLEGGYHKIVSVYKPTPQKTVKENDTTPNYNELLFPKKAEAKFTINNDVKNINISIEPEFKIEIV